MTAKYQVFGSAMHVASEIRSKSIENENLTVKRNGSSEASNKRKVKDVKAKRETHEIVY
jgi:hypothetical protein